jgi:aminoglycoside 6'-N-acetyltransferase I
MIIIQKASENNLENWLKLRKELWPHCLEEKHCHEIKAYLSSEDKCAFLAFMDTDAVGFCECTLRHDYVEGASQSPTAYLEGIYVSKSYRKQGIAKKLLEHAQSWAKNHGCNEIGSDTEIFNQASIDMHVALGFTEKNRVVHFIKKIY